MCSYKTRTGVSRFTGTQFICMRLSKFTSKLLYTVHSLPRINKKNICTFLCIYSFLPIFHINRPEEEGEKHTHRDTQIKWLNTVQSFKVFGSKLFCSCQKKKKKAKCFHSSNQTALTSYLNSSDRLPVMLCANTKGEKIYIYIKKSWIEFWGFFLSHSLTFHRILCSDRGYLASSHASYTKLLQLPIRMKMCTDAQPLPCNTKNIYTENSYSYSLCFFPADSRPCTAGHQSSSLVCHQTLHVA